MTGTDGWCWGRISTWSGRRLIIFIHWQYPCLAFSKYTRFVWPYTQCSTLSDYKKYCSTTIHPLSRLILVMYKVRAHTDATVTLLAVSNRLNATSTSTYAVAYRTSSRHCRPFLNVVGQHPLHIFSPCTDNQLSFANGNIVPNSAARPYSLLFLMPDIADHGHGEAKIAAASIGA